MDNRSIMKQSNSTISLTNVKNTLNQGSSHRGPVVGVNTSADNGIYAESLNFDYFRENLTKNLKIKNWFVMTSHQHVHIFNVDKKPNGNLSIRNTISIDTELTVNVFDVNDEILSSLKIYSWSQLYTLIEQFSYNVKQGSDVFVVTVIDEEDQLHKTTNDVKTDYETDRGTFEFCATNGEVDTNDLQRLLGSMVKVEPTDDALDWKDTLVNIKNETVEPIEEPAVEHDQLVRRKHSASVNQQHRTVTSKSRSGTGEVIRICTVCDKEFPTKKQFRNHMYLHDRTKFKTCQLCNATCFNIRRHIESVHKNVRKDVCHICGAAYKQLSSLKEHMESKHDEVGEYYCDICKNGKNYRSKGRMKSHIKNLHIRSGELDKPPQLKFDCSWCKQKLASRYSLRIHVSLKHKDEKRFRCDICDKVFKRKQALVCHQILHSGKKFDCTECGQSFNHPDYLAKHRRIHKETKA